MQALINTLGTRLGWPVVMLAGLAMVTLAILGDGLAALSGVALVGLGATGSVAQRTPLARRGDLRLLSGFVYSSLYLLFLGARLHAGHSGPLLIADFVGSMVVLAALASLLRRPLPQR